MAKAYKGFKGLGMSMKMTNREEKEFLWNCFVRLIATKEGQEFRRKRQKERKDIGGK